MKVTILKYNAGNVSSVQFALKRIGIDAIISNDKEEILSSDKVIFPGVGEAGSAMKYLKERNLDELIRSLKQPVLGICLGMQLLCDYSEESETSCVGIFKQQVRKFKKGGSIKVPQVGWNTVQNLRSSIFSGISEEEYMYFVHGYYAEIGPDTIASTFHGSIYSSALQKNNFYGVQFHPEKSGEMGQRVLKNFISL